MEVYFAGNIISLNGGLFIVTFYRRVAEDSPNQPTNQPVATNQLQPTTPNQDLISKTEPPQQQQLHLFAATSVVAEQQLLWPRSALQGEEGPEPGAGARSKQQGRQKNVD